MASDALDIDAVEASRLLGRPVRAVARLSGGEHAVTATVTDGIDMYVVRRFPPGDSAVRHEVLVLDRLEGLRDLVPALVAHDASATGPAIVTRMLPGTPPSQGLAIDTIADQLGAVLARIHAVAGTGLRAVPEAPPAGDSPIALRARQDWPDLDRGNGVLTHWDFWSGNTLWNGNTLTGVVDWSGARHGPRGIDLAWSRQDVVLLGDRDAADTLLTAYRNASGQQVQDIAAWDRRAAAQAEPVVEEWAANYAGIGRGHLTGSVLRRRLDAWIEELLSSE
ncbi:phosphotransferase family protein [Intrasporangium flavum]|uniref:phosphotransferase family protein n=1 Tax=Intrasporangium flavum TaxID=1428657 RepID=UPI001F60F47E|nr:phosphotransferase [Intrasporangium flavum]